MPYNEARRNANKRVSVGMHAQRKEKVGHICENTISVK